LWNRSTHAAFADSISTIFFARLHPFSSFSREVTDSELYRADLGHGEPYGEPKDGKEVYDR
jgi:hypothetical protein